MPVNVPHPPASTPAALITYFLMWNEPDPVARRRLLDDCVSESCEWVDPIHAHVGRQALADNVAGFKEQYPTAELGIASQVDSHHDRHRYEWLIVVDGEVLIRGLDVVTIDDDGLIVRVDGFFGPLRPLT